jgi:hypothetical protein
MARCIPNVAVQGLPVYVLLVILLYSQSLATENQPVDPNSAQEPNPPSAEANQPRQLEEFKPLSGLDNTPKGGPLPGGTLPGGTLPGGTLPGGTVPGGTLPGGPVPGGTVPGGTLPGGSLPGGTVPGGTLPGGTLAGGPL